MTYLKIIHNTHYTALHDSAAADLDDDIEVSTPSRRKPDYHHSASDF